MAALPQRTEQALRRWLPPSLTARLRAYEPQTRLGELVKEVCLGHLPEDLARELLETILACVVVQSELSGTIIRHPDSPQRAGRLRTLRAGRALDALYALHEQRDRALKVGDLRSANRLLVPILAQSGQANLLERYGVLSRRVVTTAGVGFLVDAAQNLTEFEAMKYHGIGTGTTAEAAGDSALVTELTTQYNPDSTRATGTTTEAAANIYQTVGTNTVDASVAITEHGVLSSATVGAGVLLDRSVFSALNLVSGDSLQTDYRLTLSSGG